jgi:Pyruvate/2-oxoacid:ferredoxin oxidoreductase gamma subunit
MSYADIVLAALPQAARQYLEALMRSGTYEYQSDFARRYVAEGRAEGRAEAVLAVLEERELDVPPEVRERVLACSDPDLLAALGRRAVTVASAEDLLDPLGG